MVQFIGIPYGNAAIVWVSFIFASLIADEEAIRCVNGYSVCYSWGLS